MKSARPTFPRVNCLVPGCRRGTTRAAPHDDGSPPEIICGQHWRTVPKDWRRRLALYARRYRAAEAKDDESAMRVAAGLWWGRWRRIGDLFRYPEKSLVDDMPATMVEQLRREGLL